MIIMFLMIAIGILSTVIIVKNGINKNALIISVFVSCLILTFLVQGAPVYKMVGFIVSVPVGVYLAVYIFLCLIEKKEKNEDE